MSQTIIVLAIVALAGIYLAGRVIGRLRAARAAAAGECGSDCGCSSTAKTSR